MMSPADLRLIDAIAGRAVTLYERLDIPPPKAPFIASELQIVHEEIVALRLQDLLDADDVNFMHDIAGIHGHLEIRRQSVLTDCFMPRFAKV